MSSIDDTLVRRLTGDSEMGALLATKWMYVMLVNVRRGASTHLLTDAGNLSRSFSDVGSKIAVSFQDFLYCPPRRRRLRR